jgi:hypothetical protein
MNSARLLGIVLMVAGFGIAIVAGLFLAVQIQDGLTGGGAVLGGGIAFIVVTVLVGFGIFMYVKGGQTTAQASEMQKQRQLLDIVKSRGQVDIADLAIEMKASADSVKNMVHQLVGLGVFSGYVNWEDGTLYSSDARHLRELKNCEKCGAPIELVGKGVVMCKFCGTEYFLA